MSLRKKAGELKDFKFHPVEDLYGPSGKKIGTYEVDFMVTHNDGAKEFIEAKGDHLVRDMGFRLKWALIQDYYSNDKTVRFQIVRG